MDLLKRENVQICDSAKDWKEAVRISVQPLERNGYVEERYKEEIIANIEKLGPYIVVTDNVALPHARPEQGAVKTQLAVTLFRKEIIFNEGETKARLFITLAAQDANLHLEALMHISELIEDEQTVEKMLNAADEDTLFQFFA